MGCFSWCHLRVASNRNQQVPQKTTTTVFQLMPLESGIQSGAKSPGQATELFQLMPLESGIQSRIIAASDHCPAAFQLMPLESGIQSPSRLCLHKRRTNMFQLMPLESGIQYRFWRCCHFGAAFQLMPLESGIQCHMILQLSSLTFQLMPLESGIQSLPCEELGFDQCFSWCHLRVASNQATAYLLRNKIPFQLMPLESGIQLHSKGSWIYLVSNCFSWCHLRVASN